MSHRWPRLPLLVLLPACAAVPPPPPVLPVLPDTSTFMMSFGRTLVPAKAVTSSPASGPVTVEQAWEGDYGAGIPALFDPRVAFGGLLSQHVGLVGYVSWSQLGAALQVFPRGLEVGWPVLLSLGLEGDGVGSAGSKADAAAGDARVGAGVLPKLTERAHLVLVASASYGPRRFRLVLPPTLKRDKADNFLSGNLQVVRRELRTEALLGIVFPMGWRWRAFATLEPFYIVDHRSLRASGCTYCVDDLVVTSFEANWGLAFQLGWVL